MCAEEFACKYKNRDFDPAEVQVIDVREPEEWEIYHLSGSKLIPLNTLPERLSEIDQQKKTYLLCAHGIRSLHAANYLLHNGFTDVVNVDGGIAEISLYLDQRESE
ncbi:rhodanese-like domain-containing protein [Paenactinomyces guangxiensis]|uniref:Rhodanese-like domain-containing protein n=1 Tax=Paenactinomyces guangxiensis TaxID=1490290 RepID=A0A7W1WT68_9BACL|nr:rhodanese-like domain-containing protein [Paenactinomyces guangxiensis]